MELRTSGRRCVAFQQRQQHQQLQRLVQPSLHTAGMWAQLASQPQEQGCQQQWAAASSGWRAFTQSPPSS
jgi:hypothetical protein